MKVEAQTDARSLQPSHDSVQEGFEELERYLRSAPRNVTCEEHTQTPAHFTDAPLHVGFDQLERTLKSAGLGANTRC